MLATQTCYLFNCVIISTKDLHRDHYQHITHNISQNFPVNIIKASSCNDQLENIHLQTTIHSVESSSFPHLYQQTIISVPESLIDALDTLIHQSIISTIPTYILWTDPADMNHGLFNRMLKLADKVIFDSTDLKNPKIFFQDLLKNQTKTPFLDFNWCRIAEWRKALGYAFSSEKSQIILNDLQKLEIIVNGCNHTQSFQARYLLYWMAGLLKTSITEKSNCSFKINDNVSISIQETATNYCPIDTDYILSLKAYSSDGSFVQMTKNINTQSIQIHTTFQTECLLPFNVSVSEYSLDKFIHELLLSPNHQVYLDCLKAIYP